MKYQDFDKPQKVKCTNGEYEIMSYDELCHRLGIIPDVQFVEVNKNGYIDFTLGKPREIVYLARAAREQGFKISKNLRKTIESII